MKDVYEVLRKKELELSQLRVEVQALHVAVPLLTDTEAEDDKPALQSAVNDTPQADHSRWQDRAEKL